MAAASRTVRHLRLRGPSEDIVRRTVTVLEDAVRTASLPDAGGRILLVRRLALGRIDPRARSNTVALQLERAVAGAEVDMCHGAVPGAGAAPVVWFSDALDAHTALALRLVQGPPPTEWYWPLAVRSWGATMARNEALRCIALSVADLPEAAVALPGWVTALAVRGHLDVVGRALRPSDGQRLALAAGVAWEGDTGAAGIDGSGSFGEHGYNGPTAPADGARPSRDLSPEGRIWDLLSRLAGPEADASGRARRFLPPPIFGRQPGSNTVRGSNGNGSVPESPGVRSIAPEPEAAGRERSPVPPPTPVGPSLVHSGRPPAEEGPVLDGLLQQGPGNRAAPQEMHPAIQIAAQTEVAGLLFLLAVLERLEYPGWLKRHPAWISQDVARLVLTGVLRRLRAPASDPMWTLVHPLIPAAPPPRSFVAPPSWREGLLSGRGPMRRSMVDETGRLHDPSGRLFLGEWRGQVPSALRDDVRAAELGTALEAPLLDRVVDAWSVAVRRWLRRYARIGVADLVQRSGAVEATTTHVDVWLDLRSADVRIRRAGLDLDPGWIPWLGRVVGFHYGAAKT